MAITEAAPPAKAVHSMIRVLEEARSIAFYNAAFGLHVVSRYDFPAFTLIYLRNETTAFEVELTVNKGQTVPYSLGDGYGHLAVTVTSVDQEHSRMLEAGLSPGLVRELEHDGQMLAKFFFVSDPDGYKTEVIQRGGRFI